MKLTLPWPPSANRYWRNVNGRMVKSAEARAYRDEVGYTFLKHRHDAVTGNVAIRLEFYRPAKRGDLDNRIKVTLDSLQGIGFQDDSQVVEIHARRFEDKGNPRVEVEIMEASEGGMLQCTQPHARIYASEQVGDFRRRRCNTP